MTHEQHRRAETREQTIFVLKDTIKHVDIIIQECKDELNVAGEYVTIGRGSALLEYILSALTRLNGFIATVEVQRLPTHFRGLIDEQSLGYFTRVHDAIREARQLAQNIEDSQEWCTTRAIVDALMVCERHSALFHQNFYP